MLKNLILAIVEAHSTISKVIISAPLLLFAPFVAEASSMRWSGPLACFQGQPRCELLRQAEFEQQPASLRYWRSWWEQRLSLMLA